MTSASYTMRDPTAETSPVVRHRMKAPPLGPETTIGLLSISKERSVEFLDTIDRLLSERGCKVLRFEKPTHTKPAPDSVIQDIIEQCDVVVEGLAD
ncbi:MAG: hypothetical protein RIC36_11900 [Rhodospirillales bacterium]